MRLHIYLFMFLFGGQWLLAQETGVLSGKVTGPVGEPLAGVTIVLDNTSFQVLTDAEGNFQLKAIPPGTYNLTATLNGYEAQTLFRIIIQTFGNPELSISLQRVAVQLEQVVISSSKLKRTKETPLSIQSLSGVEIANYPGSNNDVVRVAQSLPGVSPSPGGFRNDLILRGGAPNESVYYLDGMEIPNINHFSTQGSAGGPVGILNVSFIDDVSLSTSAFGAQYDNPLSGVLQFKQRNGNASQLKTNIRVSASETALTMEGPLWKRGKEKSNTTFLASVRRSYLQFLFEAIGLPIRPNYWDYQYKVTHKLNDYNELSVLGVGSIDSFSLEADGDLSPSEQAIFDQSPFINQRTNTMGISWKRRFAEKKGFSLTTLSQNYFKNGFVIYENTATKTGIILDNQATEKELKLRHETTFYWNNWKLNTGFNIQRSDYTNSTFDRNQGQYSTAIDFYKYGVFGNASTTLANGVWDVSLGFRLDDDTFLSSELWETFSPRIATSVRLGSGWRFNATWGNYFKILPYTVLGYRDANGTLTNANGRYTQSMHWVTGLEKSLGKAAKVSLEAFYKRYKDYPISLTDGVSLANKGGGFEVLGNEAISTTGTGRSYGVELLFQQKFEKNFFAIASYTFFYSEFTGLTGTYLPSVWDSRHLFSLTSGYKFKRNWEVSMRNRFAGRTPFVPVNRQETLAAYPEIILDYNRLGTEKLAVFNQLDIRIDKKWSFKSFALNVFIDIENVLGQRIPQVPQFGLERNADSSIVEPRNLLQIDNSNRNIIPTLGLVANF